MNGLALQSMHNGLNISFFFFFAAIVSVPLSRFVSSAS